MFKVLINKLEKIYTFNQLCRDQWIRLHASEISAGSRVLDVGAGTGRYRQFFGHCEYKTHDFGKTPSLVGKYTQIDYESDISNIPVPDEWFDVVLCTEVLEHVPEPIKALAELARLVRPAGLLLVTAPLGSFLHQEPYHFYGGFTPHWYRKFLESMGLDIVELAGNRGFFSFFGQESVRFCSFLRPENTKQTPVPVRIVLTLLWVLCLPLLHGFFPLIGAWADRLCLERMATVGYHVLAKKKEKEN